MRGPEDRGSSQTEFSKSLAYISECTLQFEIFKKI